MAKLNWRECVKAIQKTDGKCAYCGCSVDDSDSHMDHIIPLCQGGSSDHSNLYISCERCNRRKHGRTPEQFRKSFAKSAVAQLHRTFQTLQKALPYIDESQIVSLVPDFQSLIEKINKLEVKFYIDSITDGNDDGNSTN